MKRSDFIRRALASLGVIAVPRLMTARESTHRTSELHRFLVRGFSYHDGPAVLDQLASGQTVRLVREPANPYDDQAIAVHTAAGHKLGYVPREDNQILARLLDEDLMDLDARITAVRPERADWEKLEIAIRTDHGNT